jgi:MoCo/4Fe-4S cofactor protein with predicted Tat translocation signal
VSPVKILKESDLQPPAGDAAFRAALSEEFPDGAAVWDDAVSRRHFLRLMGASLALAGLAGCGRSAPPAEIVPAVTDSPETQPGRPVYFTSTMPFNGYGRGVLVVSREGRPIKIEGNTDHPASLGGTDVFMQASLLDLYDPDRSKSATEAGLSRPLSALNAELSTRLARSADGKGLGLLTRAVTSPTVTAQLKQILEKFPKAKWHVHDPVAPATSPFTEPVEVVYDLSHAAVIVSLDCDFLFAEPGSLAYARQFSNARRVRQDNPVSNRLYVAESTMTMTGSMADHRIPLEPVGILELARALATAVGVAHASLADSSLSAQSKSAQRWASVIAKDLQRAGRSKSLVIPGLWQPPEVHALAHAINLHLGNVGQAACFIDSIAAEGAGSLAELVADLRAGSVDTLLILDGNPVYDAPADSGFAEALAELTQKTTDGEYTALTAHLAMHSNETSFACRWHIPMAHWLESWGDGRAFDGTASLVQPLIAPMYDGVTIAEFLDGVLGNPPRGGFAILRDYWKRQVPGDFDAWWLKTLQDGVVAGTTAKPRPMPELTTRASIPAADAPAHTAIFRPDPTVWTGEFANNAWSQELPKPFTKLTWDNAIGIGIGLAKSLGINSEMLKDGDGIRMIINGQTLEGPAILLPGQAENTVLLSLGYGRQRGGGLLIENDKPRGYNTNLVRAMAHPWSANIFSIEATGKTTTLATAQNHHAMAVDPGVPGVEPVLKPDVVAKLGMSVEALSLIDRKLIRTVTLQQYQADPNFMDKLAPDEKPPLLSLFKELPKAADLQWGMVIDTTTCMGCNACVIACQAENNIPVVGKSEVINQREMHWIRIDDYFDGTVENPAVYHQPVPCMHCEDAPCEIVCPVGATTHSPEGLNEMTYNRCVGTRFCSNNCPYKVRRFNFLLYSDYQKDSRSLQYNPDVSVRNRGVMEKCTYCVQRIDRTRVQMQREVVQLRGLAEATTSDVERKRLNDLAEKQGRQVVDRLETACQQSCPTRAITFGNIADPQAEVSRTKAQPGNYTLLRNLTTKPRTSYLARVTNPNADADSTWGEAPSA